jgi:hypothetical protein
MDNCRVCIDGYNKILDNLKDLNSIRNLFDFFESCKIDNFKCPDEIQMPNIDNKEKCVRIQRKREKYYTNTYDPTFAHKLIEEQPNKEDIYKMFDLTKRENCANCVSFSLYLKGINYLITNIDSMKISVENANKFLPNYLLRYYFDGSIFRILAEHIAELKKNPELEKIKIAEKCIEKLSFIINNEQVEIFMYFCEAEKRIEKIRSYRFIPMIENDINICISREIDGILSAVDCHNLNIFISEPKILLIYDLVENSKIEKTSIPLKYDGNTQVSQLNYGHYSEWLNFYDFFSLKTQRNDTTLSYIDLLAGCFGIKLKISVGYLNSTLQITQEFMNIIEKSFEIVNKLKKSNNEIDLKINFKDIFNIIFNFSYYDENNLLYDKNYLLVEKILTFIKNNFHIFKTDETEEFEVYEKIIKEILPCYNFYDFYKKIPSYFNDGFDEIFLLELFKPITRCKTTKQISSFNEQTYYLIEPNELKLKKKLTTILQYKNFINVINIQDIIDLFDVNEDESTFIRTYISSEKDFEKCNKYFYVDLLMHVYKVKSKFNKSYFPYDLELLNRSNLVNLCSYENLLSTFIKKEMQKLKTEHIISNPESTFYRKKYLKYIKKIN